MDVKNKKKNRESFRQCLSRLSQQRHSQCQSLPNHPKLNHLSLLSAKVPEFIKKNTKKPKLPPGLFSPLQLPCHFTSSEFNPTSLLYLAPLIVHKAFGAFITHFLQHNGSLSCSPLASCPLYPNAQLSAAVETCSNREVKEEEEEEEGGVQGEGQERRMREMRRS